MKWTILGKWWCQGLTTCWYTLNNWQAFWQLRSPADRAVCSNSSWRDEFTDTGQGSFLPSFILKTEYTASAPASQWQQKPTNWATIPPVSFPPPPHTQCTKEIWIHHYRPYSRWWQKVEGSESLSLIYAKISLDVNIISSHRHNKLRHYLDGSSHWAVFPAARNREIRLHPTKAPRAHDARGSLFHPPLHSGKPTLDFHSFHYLLLFITASPPTYF